MTAQIYTRNERTVEELKKAALSDLFSVCASNLIPRNVMGGGIKRLIFS